MIDFEIDVIPRAGGHSLGVIETAVEVTLNLMEPDLDWVVTVNHAGPEKIKVQIMSVN